MRLALPMIAVATVALFALSIAQQHDEIVNPTQGAANARLTSVESNRGDFWRVARHAFADHPAGWASGRAASPTEWLRERTIPYAARDAHSLYFETAAELGLVGVLLLAAVLIGVAVSAVRAHRDDAAITAGPIAVVGMWAVHAGLDWDWELPGVTLFAVIAAGALLALGDRRALPAAVRPSRGAPRARHAGPD